MITTTAPRLWTLPAGTVIVPAGYQSDGFTLPLLLRPLAGLLGIKAQGRYYECAILHDYIRETSVFPCSLCDKLFYQALCQLGCPWWKRWILYKSVRAGVRLGY